MKKVSALVVIMLGFLIFAGQTQAASCTQTGFFRDGINMTAALINPPDVVSGIIDATGCNIGVFYDSNGVVDTAEIYGSNYFGILVLGDINNVKVDIKNSSIHDIGENPRNGSQHGVAIYYRAMESGSATGEIKGNIIARYQKGGITANGANIAVDVTNNTIDGAELSYITAANSLQFGWGAKGSAKHNIIGGNQWCGSSDYAATAVLLYDAGTGLNVSQNIIKGNSDIGIYVQGNNIIVDNNKVFDDPLIADCNQHSYDIGIGNYGESNLITNNKARNFDVPYENVIGGKNKTIPRPQN